MARTITTSSARSLPWLQSPLQAHKEWRATLSWSHAGDENSGDALYTDHSNKLYQSFWSKFCRWLAGQSVRLDQVRQSHIDVFLGTLRGRKNAPARVAERMYREELAEVPRGWTPTRNLALRLIVAECGLKLSEINPIEGWE